MVRRRETSLSAKTGCEQMQQIDSDRMGQSIRDPSARRIRPDRRALQYAQVHEYFARTERLEVRVSALEAQLAALTAAGAPRTVGVSGAAGGSTSDPEGTGCRVPNSYYQGRQSGDDSRGR